MEVLCFVFCVSCFVFRVLCFVFCVSLMYRTCERKKCKVITIKVILLEIRLVGMFFCSEIFYLWLQRKE